MHKNIRKEMTQKAILRKVHPAKALRIFSFYFKD